jgi:hypothetical protein
MMPQIEAILIKVEYIEGDITKQGNAVLDLGTKYAIIPSDGTAYVIRHKEDTVKI